MKDRLRVECESEARVIKTTKFANMGEVWCFDVKDRILILSFLVPVNLKPIFKIIQSGNHSQAEKWI